MTFLTYIKKENDTAWRDLSYINANTWEGAQTSFGEQIQQYYNLEKSLGSIDSYEFSGNKETGEMAASYTINPTKIVAEGKSKRGAKK